MGNVVLGNFKKNKKYVIKMVEADSNSYINYNISKGMTVDNLTPMDSVQTIFYWDEIIALDNKYGFPYSKFAIEVNN